MAKIKTDGFLFVPHRFLLFLIYTHTEERKVREKAR